ncbi:hypothetical protein [Muricoccus radiodurans]|uniref:hypothetical protein n=1 Tax=Muricoccus radiodurans TaxID=2231721 RepID=UPI003CF366C6
MFKSRPAEPLVMMQSADPANYFDLLRVTSKPNRAYCLRHGIRYVSAHAVMHGFHALHACYNRIFFLKDLLDLGYEGWFLHLDADAYVCDLAFDLAAHLAERRDRSFLMTHGATTEHWDINDGIFFANCAHPDTRRLTDLWHAEVMALPQDLLRTASSWESLPNDQHLLQMLLGRNPELTKGFEYPPKTFLNTHLASFIRQILHLSEPDLPRRVASVALDVERVLDQHDAPTEPLIPAIATIARALGQPVPTDDALRGSLHGSRAALADLMQSLAAAARRG